MVNVCRANEVQLMEHLINTLEYKYYKDKRKDKEKTKTISTSLIMITTQTATTTNQVLAGPPFGSFSKEK